LRWGEAFPWSAACFCGIALLFLNEFEVTVSLCWTGAFGAVSLLPHPIVSRAHTTRTHFMDASLLRPKFWPCCCTLVE
jgi:hypothetical protein